MKSRKRIVGIILAIMIALGCFALTACNGECKHGKMIHRELQAATCTAEGTDEYWECPDCKKLFSDAEGKTVIDVIPVLDKTEHNWKTTFEKDADGHWLKCSTCSATTEHKAHVEAVTEASDSTCTTKGKTEGKACSKCGYVIVEQEEKPLLPHSMTHTEAKAATCSAKGNDEYWYCSTCDTYYTDENGETASALEELETAINPDAHKFGEWQNEDPKGCGKNGTKAHKDCEYCKKHFDNEDNVIDDLVIPMDQHNFTSISVTAQPTKTEYNVGETLVKTGLTVTAHCDNCNEDVTDAEFTVENETKELVKGANAFTVKIGSNTANFTVYGYETTVIDENIDILTVDATASVDTTGLSGNIIAIETAGQKATEGFTHTGNTLTVNAELITAMKAGKTYGDFDVALFTDTYDRYEVTVSVVTKIINSYADLESIRTTTNTLDGYFILGQSFAANNDVAMQELINGWTSDPAKGFIGIFDGRGNTISNLKVGERGIFGYLGESTIRNLALVGVTVPAEKGVFTSNDTQSTTFENIYIDTNADRMYNNNFRKTGVKNVVFVSSNPDAVLFSSGNNDNSGSCTLTNVFMVGSELYGYYGGTPAITNSQAFASVDALKAAVADGTIDMDIFGDGWKAVDNYPVMNSADDEYQKLAITNSNTEVTVDVASQAIANINGATFSLKEAKQGVTVTPDGVITVTGVTGVGEFTVVATAGSGRAEKTFSYEKVVVTEKEGEFALLDLSRDSNVVDVSELGGTVTKIQSGDVVITEGFSQTGTNLTVPKSILTQLLNGKAYGELSVSLFTSAGTDRNCYVTNMTFATKLIATAQDLKDITAANTADTIDGYYIVTADFDATAAGVVRIVNNDAQSSDTVGFKGIFDGRGHIISNLETAATAYNGLGGLFGQLLSGSEVKNIAFVNMKIESNYKGLFVGESKKMFGKVENVVVTASNSEARLLWTMEGGGTMRNVLAVGFSQLSDHGSNVSVSNIMSVTGNAADDNGGFSWTGDPTYNAQPNYATVDAMLTALESENKLAAWNSPITYNNGAIYFNGKEVLKKSA